MISNYLCPSTVNIKNNRKRITALLMIGVFITIFIIALRLPSSASAESSDF